MKRTIKLLISLFAAAMLLSIATAAQSEKRAPVSPALNILAGKTDMAKAAVTGDNIGFTGEDFKRSLNVTKLSLITVEALPSEGDGKLMLGTASVSAGQSISEANLDMLTFVPSSNDIKKSSFTFSFGEGYSVTCNMFFLEKVNYSPTLSLAPESALKLSTHDSVAKCGKLASYDPEGDDVVYEIVSYPKNGSVVLVDRERGAYVYTPSAKYTGTDSFSYVARDIYGNYSAKASVEVSVRARESSVVFGDITDCNTYNAALTMAERSLMSGTDSDGVTYFVPSQTISRAEFLTVAMKAVGINAPVGADIAVFDDDADISGEFKGYVNTAYRLGLVNGSELDGLLCFLPNESITKAEAAVIINKLISEAGEVSAPLVTQTIAEISSAPTWASDAINTVCSLGIISDDGDGRISSESVVTRGETAEMIEAMIELLE